jgi:hypothetical protein
MPGAFEYLEAGQGPTVTLLHGSLVARPTGLRSSQSLPKSFTSSLPGSPSMAPYPLRHCSRSRSSSENF